MKTIKPESIALFCLLSGDVDLAKHLAEILPITCFVGGGLAARFPAS